VRDAARHAPSSPVVARRRPSRRVGVPRLERRLRALVVLHRCPLRVLVGGRVDDVERDELGGDRDRLDGLRRVRRDEAPRPREAGDLPT
jgi:hypothetical protein